MPLRGLHQAILGTPFVYDHVRPRVVGGIDMSSVYRRLEGEASRRVLDVGCGTGDALRYLAPAEAYLGVDTDARAIAVARARHGQKPGVRFDARELSPADVRDLDPTGVVLAGVLHHLDNGTARDVLGLVREAPSLRRVVTSDILFVPGRPFNNVMAMMDRGRHCRSEDGYAAAARSAGFEVVRADVMRSHPSSGRVFYFVMELEAKAGTP